MSIQRIARPDEIPYPYVRARVSGNEPARFLHGGLCPLRGQWWENGVPGPFCTKDCGTSRSITYVATTHVGLVLQVDGQSAVVWNPLQRRPETIPLPHDDVFPTVAHVDATKGIQRAYEEWMTWRALEAEIASGKAAKKAARIQAHEERVAQARIARIEREHAARVEQAKKLESIVRRGMTVRIVADPPNFAEKNRGRKPANRIPSMVGSEGQVVGLDPEGLYVFMQQSNGGIVRIATDRIRVVLSDGSLGYPSTRFR